MHDQVRLGHWKRFQKGIGMTFVMRSFLKFRARSVIGLTHMGSHGISSFTILYLEDNHVLPTIVVVVCITKTVQGTKI